MYHYYVLVLYVYAKAHILRDKEGLHVLKDINVNYVTGKFGVVGKLYTVNSTIS